MARSKLAMFLYVFSLLIMLGFAVTYLTKTEFMPYHADALSTQWQDLPKPQQILILALMKVVGGLALAFFTLAVWVLVSAYWQGQKWAFWALPICGNIAGIPTLYAMYTVLTNTPAEPPILPPLLGLVAFNVGLLVTHWKS
ncbi:hypothetical protein [Veronia pacifica]|uniref:Uncharacterized protein n=1 Tax=Veronia pacifica TaxID=1080227 RepID=A0A1C3EKW3_9GAMM|nr:hypothetical protein [Veronia pacifica]ODA33869.1 hypothetical protein A8L45_08570 [Veronia pacifica]